MPPFLGFLNQQQQMQPRAQRANVEGNIRTGQGQGGGVQPTFAAANVPGNMPGGGMAQPQGGLLSSLLGGGFPNIIQDVIQKLQGAGGGSPAQPGAFPAQRPGGFQATPMPAQQAIPGMATTGTMQNQLPGNSVPQMYPANVNAPRLPGGGFPFANSQNASPMTLQQILGNM